MRPKTSQGERLAMEQIKDHQSVGGKKQRGQTSRIRFSQVGGWGGPGKKGGKGLGSTTANHQGERVVEWINKAEGSKEGGVGWQVGHCSKRFQRRSGFRGKSGRGDTKVERGEGTGASSTGNQDRPENLNRAEKTHGKNGRGYSGGLTAGNDRVQQ